MSNYSKYLQTSFLPSRLPVAEALWSIEKDYPGKKSHTLLQERMALSTHAKLVAGLCLWIPCGNNRKLCMWRAVWEPGLRNFKTNLKSILDGQVYGEMGHMMFSEYSRNNRTVQARDIKIRGKAQVIWQTLLYEHMTSTPFLNENNRASLRKSRYIKYGGSGS